MLMMDARSFRWIGGWIRAVVAAVAAAVVVLASTTVATAAATSPAAVRSALCGSGYVSASLPWGHKCLRAGEFCKIGNRAYIRFGFICPATGHLRRH
jgi:hypothetical protein